MISQHVRFCTSDDGTRVAYAVTGSGPVLVRAPHWLTHLEHDWKMDVRREWIERLSRHFTLVRFDPRGCGLSDRNVAELSLESWVADLEAVARAERLERFALLGPSQGGAVAIVYAVRHPARVSQLILFGAFARGKLARDDAAQIEDAHAQLKLVELGWGSDDPAYRQFFAAQMIPGASPDAQKSLTEMMRLSASPAYASRLIRMFYEIDIAEAARRVRCPTLVFHSRGDRRVPHEEGRQLAALIPGARLVTLESINHMLPPQDAAWEPFLRELLHFLPPPVGGLSVLSEREREVLEEVARGLDNATIAALLGVSEKTIRNHVTRIFDKMRVRRRAEAIVRAREAGLGTTRALP
jgi:pimeloyl-ACP methyl ester carboxylesterase/DNA-binding CsgD family transcriptional regulator